MVYFLFFILGVLTNKLGYLLLQINPLQKFWKLAEINCLKILADSETLHAHSLAVLELAYIDTDKEEQFATIKEKIISKHKEQQMRLITLMCKLLPYETNYKTPEEAFVAITELIKREELSDE